MVGRLVDTRHEVGHSGAGPLRAQALRIAGLKVCGMALAGVLMALLMLVAGRHHEAGPYASAFWSIVQGVAAVIIPVTLRLRRDHSPRAWLTGGALGGALFGLVFVGVINIAPRTVLLPPRPADPTAAVNLIGGLAALPGALLTGLLFGVVWGLLYALIGIRVTRHDHALEQI